MLMPSVFNDSLFDDFMNDFPFYDDKDMKRMEKKVYGRHGKNMMKTDIRETDSTYELEMDLPGFKKEEVRVSLEDGNLIISAQKGAEDEEKKAGKYIRRERFTGACERSFYVGDDLTVDDIKGEFRHGILRLTIPKKEEKPAVEAKKYISIEG